MDWTSDSCAGDGCNRLRGLRPRCRMRIEGVTPGSALGFSAVARDGTDHSSRGAADEGARHRRSRVGACSECSMWHTNAASPSGSWGGRRHRVAPLPASRASTTWLCTLLLATGRCFRASDVRLRPVVVFVAPCNVQHGSRRGKAGSADPTSCARSFRDGEIVHSREGDAAEPGHRPRCRELIARKPAEFVQIAPGGSSNLCRILAVSGRELCSRSCCGPP